MAENPRKRAMRPRRAAPVHGSETFKRRKWQGFVETGKLSRALKSQSHELIHAARGFDRCGSLARVRIGSVATFRKAADEGVVAIVRLRRRSLRAEPRPSKANRLLVAVHGDGAGGARLPSRLAGVNRRAAETRARRNWRVGSPGNSLPDHTTDRPPSPRLAGGSHRLPNSR
jgi:hypothetical protein